MVGDWFEDGYKSSQVTSITCDGIVETTSAISNIDVVEPIELTEEILVKNGFRYTANAIGRHNCKCYELEQEGVYHMTISIYKNEITCELDKVDAMYMNVVTNCVHTLQHLLRLCGIDKEITI